MNAMDSLPTSSPAGEMRTVMDGLVAGIGCPLGALRGRLERIRLDGSGALSPEQLGHLDTMAELCDAIRTLIETPARDPIP